MPGVQLLSTGIRSMHSHVELHTCSSRTEQTLRGS